jgi:hypothetical protein
MESCLGGRVSAVQESILAGVRTYFSCGVGQAVEGGALSWDESTLGFVHRTAGHGQGIPELGLPTRPMRGSRGILGSVVANLGVVSRRRV